MPFFFAQSFGKFWSLRLTAGLQNNDVSGLGHTKDMKRLGCFGWLGVFLAISLLSTMFQNLGSAAGGIIALLVVALLVAVVIVEKRAKKSRHSSGLLSVADKIENWASGNTTLGTAETVCDEEALFDLTSVELLEFKSTGSSYSGGNVGVSFPIFGRIRGNIGGSQGQITRNPEELSVIDNGTLKVTSKRLIYIGEKEARVFELPKVLDFELGPNGLWLKIAMSNKPKREAFQHMNLDQIPVGIAVGIANAWSNEGRDSAIKYANDITEQIRSTVAAQAKKP